MQQTSFNTMVVVSPIEFSKHDYYPCAPIQSGFFRGQCPLKFTELNQGLFFIISMKPNRILIQMYKEPSDYIKNILSEEYGFIFQN